MSKENTFGEYQFDDWVPEHTQEIIRDFWGCFGRTYEDWLRSPGGQGVRQTCHHGPGPNGFGMPPLGATVDYYLSWGPLRNQWVRGRYVHRWNNMGSLVDENGDDHTVSTGDRWVRVWLSDEEKEIALS